MYPLFRQGECKTETLNESESNESNDAWCSTLTARIGQEKQNKNRRVRPSRNSSSSSEGKGCLINLYD